MKKLIFVLLPISIIIALVCIYTNKELSYYGLLEGLNTIELKDFDYKKIVDAFNHLNITDTFTSMSDIWGKVDGIGSFFVAIGESFTLMIDTMIATGEAIYYCIVFFFEFFGYLFNNLISFIKFLFNYLFS